LSGFGRRGHYQVNEKIYKILGRLIATVSFIKINKISFLQEG
jgi:alkyl sulfatase BDS1-like metallo-beta-lactamase superfamily hydrolase